MLDYVGVMCNPTTSVDVAALGCLACPANDEHTAKCLPKRNCNMHHQGYRSSMRSRITTAE